ncbi:IS1/IS1595 family N-terminal zinc-binding domain-containing protein [Geotalea uraniireducens]
MICPACHAEVIHRLGKTVKGRQSFVCFTCGKEFVPQSVSAAAQRQ